MKRLIRRQFLRASFLLILQPLTACGKGETNMHTGVVLDVVLYNFIDRPIFDIYLSGTDLGVADPYGGTSVVTGVPIPYGPQRLSWRWDGPEGTPGNGDTIALRNTIEVRPDQIGRDCYYMGIYLYPDRTAEVIFSEHIPENSRRGENILEELKNAK